MSYVSMSGPNAGMGDYQATGNWSWEFYPPPYDFLGPPATMPAPGVVLPEDVLQYAGVRGLRGVGCGAGSGCSCGCKAAPHVHSFAGVTSPGYPGGLGDDASAASDALVAPSMSIPTDFSSLVSNLGQSFQPMLQTLSTSQLMGVPAWVWLAGGAVLYVWLFTGGTKYSRVSRIKKRAGRAKARAKRMVPKFS